MKQILQKLRSNGKHRLTSSNKKELVINGYIRRLNYINLNIPIDVTDIIISYYPLFSWSNKLTDKCLIFEADFTIINNYDKNRSSSVWSHAFDENEYDNGIHKWKIKILYEIKSTSNHWTIGIIPTQNIKNILPTKYFPCCNGFGYNSGAIFDYGTSYKNYGKRYGTGDIIETKVDFNDLTISFAKNNENFGKCQNENNEIIKLEKNVKYRFVVASYCSGDKFKLIHYS